MWVFTKYGLISVSCAKEEGVMALRFRTQGQVENFQNRFPVLAAQPVQTSETADYRYRILVEKKTWVMIAAELAEEIDYTKFKSSVIDFPGKDEYHDRLLEVWAMMCKSQLTE